MSTIVIDEALDYCRRGFSVIPLKQNKKPLTPWERYQQEKATEDKIREWWKQWPSANVGIVTGGVSRISVIDVDEPQRGIPELMKLIPDESMPTVRTPSGGQHFYFRSPDEPLGNNVRIIPGCDFRGLSAAILVLTIADYRRDIVFMLWLQMVTLKAAQEVIFCKVGLAAGKTAKRRRELCSMGKNGRRW